MKGRKAEKRSERGDALRAYFVRLFGKYDFRNEAHFLYFGKWLVFILVCLVECLLLLQQLSECIVGGKWWLLIVVASVVLALSVSIGLQFFVAKGRAKLFFYGVDVVAACTFPIFAGGVYSVVLYMLVLTQFYFETKRPKYAFLLLLAGVGLYVLAYGIQTYLVQGALSWDLWGIINSSFGFIVGIVTHFLAVQISLAFYRQYLKLEQSKKELEKAYAVVAEVTALEERQRIAKEIHDTAGHSITTVIMQTETAKRIIDTSPEEAKQKLIAANLQARHALEELRDSVHLLSGSDEQRSLKEALLGIIHESTDGTGITVRFDVAEIEALPAKHRFLCNTLKEGISNGLRHGGATAFWFELKEEEGKILFLLSDNGKGLEGKELRLGFGLSATQQRAAALGGEASFFSDEEGFELRLRLPTDRRD